MALELISRYWLQGDGSDPLLNVFHLLRNFRAAEDRARARLLESLHVNNNDLAALRFVLVESERDPVGIAS